VLAPIAKLAEIYNVAILVVAHRRKASGDRADDSVLGSVGFTGIARAVWHLTRDKSDKDRRLLLPGKMNIAKTNTGLAFKIADSTMGMPTLCWEAGPVEMNADDAFAQEHSSGQPGPNPAARTEAEQWLMTMLADGQPHRVRDIKAASADIGYSWATVKRAAEHLAIFRQMQEAIGGPAYWRIRLATTAPETS
jgi:hypothetical protein